MKIYVKMLQGAEKLYEVNSHTTGAELKQKVAKDLNIDESSQRLVFKGKPVSDEIVLSSIGIGENARIHLMVKKGESKPSSTNFYVQLDTLLRNHLSHEQTLKVIGEFKKNCQVMIDSMNFDDIERFAASNFTQF
ncbi:UNVERIFIED_CONTAM: hypothetical protein RMT77_011848 [Armadillidium vulgare]